MFIVPVGPLIHPEAHIAGGGGPLPIGGGEGHIHAVEVPFLPVLFAAVGVPQEGEGDVQKIGGRAAELQLIQLGHEGVEALVPGGEGQLPQVGSLGRIPALNGDGDRLRLRDAGDLPDGFWLLVPKAQDQRRHQYRDGCAVK